jgi:hypothetical protein
MTSKLNSCWMAAALIWLAAIVVSYLNFTEIHEVATLREKNDRLRHEMLFQYRNTARLDQIHSMEASCFLPVASAKLGFEAVRSRLQRLAAHLGLNGVKISAQMEQATENRTPLRLRLQGTFEETANYIAALQYIPYLAMKSSRVVVAYPKPDAEIELEFNFQFKIDPAQELEIRSLHAAGDPLENKAVYR